MIPTRNQIGGTDVRWGVNTNRLHPARHAVALELLLRLAAVALVTFVILGLLPAIAEAAT
jgi:hypothetical protein